MKFCAFTLLVYSATVFAGLTSPFSSSVEGVSIPNTHQVDTEGKVFRGMAPLGKVSELKELGISDILIFKNQTNTEIDDELTELQQAGFDLNNVTQFDFLWHDFPSYKLACEQTIEALKAIKEVAEDGQRKLFFHCTVGEDRTGYLAGLWRMLSQGHTTSKAFYKEMCENGYGRGNPNKPYIVVKEIREDLTPLFMYMAEKIVKGELSYSKLNTDICRDDLPKMKKKYCKVSSKL